MFVYRIVCVFFFFLIIFDKHYSHISRHIGSRLLLVKLATQFLKVCQYLCWNAIYILVYFWVDHSDN